MHDNRIRFEARFGTKETAKLANMSEATVRKYSQSLVNSGYHIETLNGRDRRYSDQDITMLIEMKRLRDETGLDVDKLAKMVIAEHGRALSEGITTQGERLTETNVMLVPQDFTATVERAGRQFWAAAREELLQDVRGVVRDEVRAELQDEMGELKSQLAEIAESQRQAAAGATERKKPWWKFG